MFWLLAPLLKPLLDPRAVLLALALLGLQAGGVDIFGAIVQPVIDGAVSTVEGWLSGLLSDSLLPW
jgi:hypothetical protein